MKFTQLYSFSAAREGKSRSRGARLVIVSERISINYLTKATRPLRLHYVGQCPLQPPFKPFTLFPRMEIGRVAANFTVFRSRGERSLENRRRVDKLQKIHPGPLGRGRVLITRPTTGLINASSLSFFFFFSFSFSFVSSSSGEIDATRREYRTHGFF